MYPHLDAFNQHADEINAILEFADCYGLSNLSIRQYGDAVLSINVNDYILDTFGVDMNEVERERSALLRELA